MADVHDGAIILYCHILPHEDEGTMAQELIMEGGRCECDALFKDGVPTGASSPISSLPDTSSPTPSPTGTCFPTPSRRKTRSPTSLPKTA